MSAGLAYAAASPEGNYDNYVNVKDFGSKGDGKTDDTAAIQAAIDSIPIFWNELKDPQKFPQGKVNRYSMNQPYVLFFPAGTYRVSRPLSAPFKNRLTILGYGARFVWYGAEFGTLFDLRNGSFLNIKGLFIDGNSRLGTALRFGISRDAYKDFMNSNVTGIHVEDVTVKRMINRGRPIDERQAIIDTVGDYNPTYLSSVQDSVFENVIIESGGEIGFAIGTSEVKFVGGIIAGPMEGVRFYTGTASFYGVTFTGGSGAHITIYKDRLVDTIRFFGSYFEGYKEALIKEIGSTREVDLNTLLFEGCIFSNPAPEFISLKNRQANLYLFANRYMKNPNFSEFKVSVGENSNILVLENYNASGGRPKFLSGNVMRLSK